MFERKLIPVPSLVLDGNNPRLLDDQDDEAATILAISKVEGGRLYKLAEDIVVTGTLSPLELTGVIPLQESPHSYRVIEGNRRVAALKALETPALAEPGYSPSMKRKWRELHEKFVEDPIEEIECVVFDNEEQVERWVEVRHAGQQEGVGLVEWGAREKDRWARRHGRGGPWGEILDFVQEKGSLSPEGRSSKKKVLTNVRRIINTPEVRERLGIEVTGRKVVSKYPLEEVSKGVSKVVDDLLTERIRVGDIYHKDQRLDYINSFSSDDLPSPDTQLDHPVPLTDLTPSPGGDPKRAKKNRRRPKKPRQEVALIPRGVVLEIPHDRVHDIYEELKRLEVASFTNSVAVMLRVFLELSVDHYLGEQGILADEDRDKPLAKRLKKASEHLEETGKMDNQQRKAVDQAADGKLAVAASTPTLNQYVHNPHVFPAVSDLRAAWNQLQPLLEAIWSHQ